MIETARGDFTLQAEAYAKARPGYPLELIARLVDLAGVAPGDPVADVGAGTGLFTSALTGHGLVVTAIEPNQAMRDKAPADGVTWRDGTFEETGLPAASQRWVVAAQAFHWADPPRALPEMHRILAPGGSFTVLWNNRDVDGSPLLAWTRDAIHRRVPDFDEGYRRRDWPAVLTSTGHFAPPVESTVRHVVRMDRERFLDLWRSHHLLNHAAGPATMAELLQEIAAHLAGADAILDVPYLCRAWTSRRLGGP